MTLNDTTREALIERVMGELKWLAAKYAPMMPHDEYDDVLAMCYEYMLKAIEGALQEHIDDRAGYVYKAVENQLIGHIQKGRHRLVRMPGRHVSPVLSLDVPIRGEEGTYTLADVISAEKVVGSADLDYGEIVEGAVDRLEDGLQRELIRRYWGIGCHAPESVYALRKTTKRSTPFIQKQLAYALSRLREDRQLGIAINACKQMAGYSPRKLIANARREVGA